MSTNLEALKYVDTMPKKEKLLRFVWNFVWLVFFRPTPRWCLNGWRILLLKLFGAKIGRGSRVLPSCFVWAPWKLTMGEFSVLAEGVECYSMSEIIIGSKVAVSQRSFICTGSHDISSLKRPLVTKPIVINDHAWICSEAFISPGVIIGEGAVIAARSVVIKNIDSWTVVGGNPSKFIKNRVIKD